MNKTDSNINATPQSSHSRESGNLGCPRNWTPTNLGAVIELKYGKSLPARTRDGGQYPVFGSNGVVGSHSIPLVKSTGIIVGRKGSYGEVQFSEKPFYPIDTTYFIDEFFQQPQKYWFHQLKLLPLTTLNRSTAIPGLNREDAYAQPIFLPPLAEQKIIADKLDELLAQVDTLKARLDAIPAILKRFRQSVLAAAVSGKLTEEWRSTTAISNAFKKVKLADIILEMRNGLSPKPNETRTGNPILRISSVRSFSIDQDDIRYLVVSDNDRTKYSLKIDDLLFTRYNGSAEFVGVCGKINTLQHDTLLYPDKLIRVRVNHEIVLPAYVEIFSASHLAKSYISSLIKSTSGQKGISGGDLKKMPVSLPSLEEQTEIVRRVEQLFTYADQVEQQVKNAQARVNQLTQSILAKAFRGELTEQWRQDNPELISGNNSAAALLERIKAERAAAKPAKKKAPARKAKA